MAELVPNTPSQATDQGTNTQRSAVESVDHSYSDSYLIGALSSPSKPAGHSSPAPAGLGNLTSSPSAALDDIEDPDISRVPNSQRSPAAVAEHESAAMERRRSGGSASQPPYEVSGNFGETQVQSLGRPRDFAPYRYREEGSRRESDISMELDRSLVEEGDTTTGAYLSRGGEEGEVSMDLTRAAGGIHRGEEDVSMAEDKLSRGDAGKRVEDVHRSAEQEALPAVNSQKENSHGHPPQLSQLESLASNTIPPSHSRGAAPLGPRTSHFNVDSATTGPSSSPAVAMNLLQGRLSPSKRPIPPRDEAAPDPSANTEPPSSNDFTGSFLLPQPPEDEGEGHASSRSKSMPELSQDVSGPETSTPAFTGAAPPRPPLTAARTLPNFARIPNPVLPAPSMPLADTGGKGMAVYQSSEVMATMPVVVKKKKKDEWDDSSQETLESLRKAAVEGDEVEEEEELPETEVVQEESLAATDPDGEASMSMSLDRTAGAEVDMSLDSRVETPRASAVQSKNLAAGAVAAAPSEAVKEDETQNSLTTSNAASAPPAHQPSPGSLASSTALRRKRSAGETPLFAPDVDSQSQSINGDLEESHDTRQTLNLTDIGLMSSQADQTQIEVEATQVEYDVERLAPVSVSGDLSVGSSVRGLPAFRYETGDSASSHLNSGPRPGRELRRIPPPPSPVYPATPAAAAAIAKRLGTLPPATSSSPDIPLPPTAIASVISSSPRIPQGDKTSSPGPAAESAPAADETTPRSHPAPSDSLRHSSAAKKPHSYSSNGVVPDSEGPTQDEGQAPGAAARPSPRRASEAPAQAVDPVVDDSMDVDEERGAQDDYGGGGEKETEQALPEREPTPEPEPAAVVVAAATKKSPSKSKKTAPRAHKTSPAKRDKGKGRAVEPGSPDELDCFQPTQPHVDRFPPLPHHEDVESEPMLETNYEEPPGLDNSKRPSPKKRTVSGAPPTVSPASTVARKRRASELEPVVEIPVSTKRAREPFTKKAALKKPKGKAPARGKAKAKGMATSAGGKKRGRSRKLVSSSESEGSPSSEEEDEEEDQRVPVAGPSCLRFDSVDEIMPDISRASTGPSEQGGKPNVGGRKSKLPASAPFTRVFGLWRDDGWIYPGTIVGVSGGRVDVVFDDESKGKLLFEELRRCELKRGDYIRYRGTEIDTETQAETLARDLRVYRVESGVDGSDVEGHLQPEDVVVATKVDVAFEDQSKEGDRCQRLNVEGIAIVSEHVAQLDDRKLTPAEIAAFSPPSAKAIKPLTLLNHPPSTVLEPVVFNRKLGIFSRMAFLITSTPASGTDSEKAAFVKLLEEHGGTVLESAHLFTIRTPEKGGDSTLEFARRSGLDKIDFILLLAERPCTTSKYLVALSLGIPCVSSRFVYSSIQDGARLEWKDFALTSGYLQSLGTYAVGAQVRSIAKASYNIESLVTLHEQGGTFSGRSILFVTKKGRSSSEQIGTILSILAAAGATKVHFVGSPENAGSGAGYHHIILEDSLKRTSAMSGHHGVANMTWLKQCLIAGRLLPSAMLKAVTEEA